MEDGDTQETSNGNGLKGRATGKVREISEAAREQAEQRVRNLTDKARERAQETVEQRRERLASRVEEAASGLLHHAEEGDNLRYEAERRVGRGLESAAGYLHSHQTTEVAGDVGVYVHEHPVRAMIMAAIIGYFLAKILS
jgi:ElaB/YqjD/DUF883 family membrane-anchored ribosome-binding protein